jgi:glycosyltransferase 2 family protein
MIASAKAPGSSPVTKLLRAVLQALVSVALIALLIYVACRDTSDTSESLTAAWSHVGPQTFLLACGVFASGVLCSARRWQLLLRNQGIQEPFVRLTELYAVGLFCSLFLPTAAGGDAYRVYEVARRGRPAARVLLATLHDRLLGLGATMLVGLAAALWFHAVLPGKLLVTVLLVYVPGILAVAAVLYHGRVLGWLRRSVPNGRLSGAAQAFFRGALGRRFTAFLRPLGEARPLSARDMFRGALLALATFVAAVAMYGIACAALDAFCGPLALCLVVSLVGVVRMLPVSLNGIGVGEGAFVFLMSLFGVAPERAVPVALVLLAVQTVMSLGGGLLLLRRMLFRSTTAPAAPAAEEATPVLLPLPACAGAQGGARRHAA